MALRRVQDAILCGWLLGRLLWRRLALGLLEGLHVALQRIEPGRQLPPKQLPVLRIQFRQPILDVETPLTVTLTHGSLVSFHQLGSRLPPPRL